MAYQWDREKATRNLRKPRNLRKHGIDFADAVAVFEDQAALTLLDEQGEEERCVTLGLDALGRRLVVVYTWRGDDIRSISARKATRAERAIYEAG